MTDHTASTTEATAAGLPEASTVTPNARLGASWNGESGCYHDLIIKAGDKEFKVCSKLSRLPERVEC